MMEVFSIEFWMAVLFFIDFFLVIFLFVLVKKMNRLNLGDPSPSHHHGAREAERHAFGSAADIIELLEPLVEESRNAAVSFDQQIKEKKRLIKEVNDALDSRMIGINLLLSRADALQKKLENSSPRVNQPNFLSNEAVLNASSNAVIDQQHQIIEMYNQHFDIAAIARSLSIPKGEVQLVIELKKKFIEMEKNNR